LAENVQERTIAEEALSFADEVARIASRHVRFFVLDIAEMEHGGWTLIEINDGQTSGLSENDPHELYGNLKAALAEHHV
jgi:hypothetical protein